jgi:hypothetical protein
MAIWLRRTLCGPQDGQATSMPLVPRPAPAVPRENDAGAETM